MFRIGCWNTSTDFERDDSDRTPTGSGNKIIHSDNLKDLKSLLPKYTIL